MYTVSMAKLKKNHNNYINQIDFIKKKITPKLYENYYF